MKYDIFSPEKTMALYIGEINFYRFLQKYADIRNTKEGAYA